MRKERSVNKKWSNHLNFYIRNTLIKMRVIYISCVCSVELWFWTSSEYMKIIVIKFHNENIQIEVSLLFVVSQR